MTRIELLERREHAADVPCGTCSACCRNDRIVLCNADALSRYRWHQEGSQAVLDRKPNGECIYLTGQGCGIHATRPDVCRRFDCRVLFLLTAKDERRNNVSRNLTMRAVYDAGKLRLGTLQGGERGPALDAA